MVSEEQKEIRTIFSTPKSYCQYSSNPESKVGTKLTTNAKVVSISRAEAKKKDESQVSINERGPSPDVAVVACCCHL